MIVWVLYVHANRSGGSGHQQHSPEKHVERPVSVVDLCHCAEEALELAAHIAAHQSAGVVGHG